MLWAGYWIWMKYVNPETAAQHEREQVNYDEQGRYRSSGSAKNAAKADQEFWTKYEKFKNKTNAEQNPKPN